MSTTTFVLKFIVSIVVTVFWMDISLDFIADKGFIFGPYLRYRQRRRERARRVVETLKGAQ